MNKKIIDDRRQSFRVEMNTIVSVRSIADGLIEASDYFPELHSMALMSESVNIDSELIALTDRIKDLTVKKTIGLLGHKLTILTKLINIQAFQNNQLVTQKIDISEGGCSIQSNEPLVLDQKIALALIFTPSFFSLFSFATVTGITETPESKQYHLAFEDLTEHQKQHLIKHMFKAQTSTIKS